MHFKCSNCAIKNTNDCKYNFSTCPYVTWVTSSSMQVYCHAYMHACMFQQNALYFYVNHTVQTTLMPIIAKTVSTPQIKADISPNFSSTRILSSLEMHVNSWFKQSLFWRGLLSTHQTWLYSKKSQWSMWPLHVVEKKHHQACITTQTVMPIYIAVSLGFSTTVNIPAYRDSHWT